MTLAQFPNTNTFLHRWIKNYVHKYIRQGPTVAARYLREFVPSQLHQQVVKTGEKIIKEKRKRSR